MPIDHARMYSDDEIEQAMATVARVIELYGDTYWPILERLEHELEERRAKSSRLSRHLKRFHGNKRRQFQSPPKVTPGHHPYSNTG